MSTLEDLEDLEREQKEDKKDDGDKDKKPNQSGDAEMKDADAEEKEEDPIDEEIYSLSTQDILTRRRLLENDTRIMKSEFQRVSHEKATMGEKIKDNLDKIENNRYAKVDGTSHDNRANINLANYHISSAMLLSFLTLIQLLSPRKKELISTSMPHEWENRQLSRLPPDKPSSFLLLVSLTQNN